MSSPESLPDVSAWQAQVLRLTVFSVDSIRPVEQEWWANAVGEPPENRASQSRQTLQQDDGPYGKGVLTLKVETRRIDWLYAARINPDAAEAIPHVGDLPAAVRAFTNVTEQWLASCPLPKRVAFGAILIQPASDLAAGYRLIDRYLPFVELDSSARDFLFRINRPRQSSVAPELLINRLSSWSVMRTAFVHAELSEAQATRPETRSEHFAGRLELDINTDKDREDGLPLHLVVPLFRELVDFGIGIGAKGDTP